mmetsp:Transcript_45315/g.58069  ORF Transcript_45315/g.58069 Transcript_45315/m.58069 type:complete len:146 (-) Transcript_45315:234-671(-)
MKTVQNRTSFLFFLFITVLILSVIWNMASTDESIVQAFSLLVTLKFSDPESLGIFKEEFQPLADHVRDNEPNTIAYEVLLSDKDPLRVLILERYKDKERDFLGTHKNSEPFLAFRPKLAAMQEKGLVTIDGDSFVDSNIGFADRV